MNREPNNEIDILLRKLSGKQNGNIAADRNSSTSHEHLDTDELNAYAENALPMSIRSRYTEHLADCSSCRKLITQLSLSSTAAVTHAPIEESTPSRLKMFLAGLFAPIVMKYAVPAMAVILVVALAWIVVRREPVNNQVAQNERQQLESAPAQPTTTSTVANAPKEPSSTPAAGPPTEPNRKQAASDAEPAAATAGNKAPEASKEGEVAAAKQEPAPAPPPAKAAPVTVAAAPSTGSVAGVQPKAVSQVDRAESEPKKKADSDTINVQNQNQNQNVQQERRANDQRSGPSEPKAVQRGLNRSNQAVGGAARQRDKLAEAEEKDAARDDEAEVKTVGGHRFTKREGVWVDALYRSNSATTNISRGSEQYRSLVGDEPGLREIVQQLSGEMIVVWKNRAYRIK